MDMRDLQAKVAEVIKAVDAKHGAKHDIELTFIHLVEELGELSAQIYNSKTKREKMNRDLLESGIADCVMLLLQIADNYDVDAQKAIEDKLTKLKKRFKA